MHDDVKGRTCSIGCASYELMEDLLVQQRGEDALRPLTRRLAGCGISQRVLQGKSIPMSAWHCLVKTSARNVSCVKQQGTASIRTSGCTSHLRTPKYACHAVGCRGNHRPGVQPVSSCQQLSIQPRRLLKRDEPVAETSTAVMRRFLASGYQTCQGVRTAAKVYTLMPTCRWCWSCAVLQVPLPAGSLCTAGSPLLPRRSKARPLLRRGLLPPDPAAA